MPFSVTQVNKVQFGLIEPVSADDFLKLILENGEVMYVRLDEPRSFLSKVLYDPSFEFDPEFLPASLKAQIDTYVDTWVSRELKYQCAIENVQEEIAALRRQKKSIRRWYMNQLYRSLQFVRGSSKLDRAINIGTEVIVAHDVINPDGGNVIPWHWYPRANTRWVSSAPIAAILPISRDAIRLELDSQ